MPRRTPDPGKRAQILRAATGVFSAREFHAVPVDDIASAAGVGKGTLYLYFPTKEHLFYATVLDALDLLLAELTAATQARRGEDALRAFVDCALQFFWRRQHLAVLMHRYEHKQDEPEGGAWRERRARILAMARAIIHPLAVTRPLDGDVTLAAEMLLALIRAAVLNHQDRDRPERAAALIVELFLRGLARRRPRNGRRPLRRARALAIALALAGTLASGCSHEARTAEGTAPQVEPVPVSVAPVSTAIVERAFPLVGAFFANEEVAIAAQIDARVAWIGADMGDHVNEGDVLVRLDDADLLAALREVEARLAKARADNARAQLLRQKGIMAAEEAERTRTEAAVLEAQRDVLRVKIDRTVIRAPLRAAVAARSVSVGEVVKTGQPLYRLVQDDPLKFRTPIPERFAQQLRLDEHIRVEVDAYPGRTFDGYVTRINPTSDAANRSITTEALVQNREGLLKPGFFAKGELVYDQRGEALAVPESALTTFAGITKLFVVKDGKAEERIVRTGEEVSGARREIIDGVAPGETVAVSNVERLEQGTPVTVTEQRP